MLKCEVVVPAQRPFLYTHSATFRSKSFNIRSVSSVPFSEKICPFDKLDLSALYATMQRSRSFESCIQVILNISSLPFAFCSNRSVSNKICIRKAACADSFACFFNFEASVPVRIDDASITANVTGYVLSDKCGSVRKKQNRKTLSSELAMLQTYPFVRAEITNTPKI